MNKLALSALIPLLISGSALAGEKIDQSRDVQINSKVVLETTRANVEVIGWDKPQFKVEGELDDKAEGYELTVRGRKVFFEVKLPEHLSNSSWNRDISHINKLVFYVPNQGELHLENMDGHISIQNVLGDTRAETVNGDVKLMNLARDIRVETVNGSIEAEQLDGDIKLQTVNGGIFINRAAGEGNITAVNGNIKLVGDLRELAVENVNGSIDLELMSTKELEVVSVNGGVDLTLRLPKDGEVEVSSVSSDINITLVGEVNSSFDLDSHAGGNVRTNLTHRQPKTPKYGPGESLEFRVGDGSSDVEVTTVSGDISVQYKKSKTTASSAEKVTQDSDLK